MKTLYKLQLLLVLSIVHVACKNSVKKDRQMKDEMILQLKITDFGMIGYGEIYACEVLEVHKGTFDAANISLTVVTKDHLISSQIKSLPITVNITFSKHKENEPYKTMPIDGFVDEDNTSWVIDNITLVK